VSERVVFDFDEVARMISLVSLLDSTHYALPMRPIIIKCQAVMAHPPVRISVRA
jgi:hypothetical protein